MAKKSLVKYVSEIREQLLAKNRQGSASISDHGSVPAKAVKASGTVSGSASSEQKRKTIMKNASSSALILGLTTLFSTMAAFATSIGGQGAVKLIAVVFLAFLAAPERTRAQIDVDTTTPGNTSGAGCSIQEAIYATEFGTNVALDQTDPDNTYYTGCSDPSGQWNTIALHKTTYTFTKSWDGDAHNPFGPTATPIIFKKITIQGNGATLKRQSAENFRLFAIGQATIPYSGHALTGVVGGSYSGTGDLTLVDVDVKGFQVKGGDGGSGAGGGLGAGGAIYVGKVSSGIPALTVENSTFENNNAIGGNGTPSPQCCNLGGGGGGLGGNGGAGGGGARGNGADGPGGGGGGTIFGGAFPAGGYMCGGDGASFQLNGADDGHDGTCPGGGGGAADNDNNIDPYQTVYGGDGAYGGGGGGSFIAPGDNGNGGNGGFGGGGGFAYWCIGTCSGDGGFGGGGGGTDGSGGHFGGNGGESGAESTGGGGGALGGAIFSDNGHVVIQNSTFNNNAVTRGVGGGGSADNGGDSGGAIFSRNGTLVIENATISNNQATGAGGGVVVYEDGGTTIFILDNTIIANNGDQECITHGSVTTSTASAPSAGNLIVNNSGCPAVAVNTDPKLDSLKPNAPGDTLTMALLSDSPAIAAADASTSLPTDQRGETRKSSPDIGAYETVPQADLSLTKSVAQSTYKAGDTVVYTLTVTNNGPNDASTVVVTDTYPSPLTYVSCTASGGTCGVQNGSVVANYASLTANASAAITISGTLNSGLSRGTVVSNGASVSDSSPEDPVTTNNSGSANFTVIVPDFSLSATTPITIAVGGSGTSTQTVSSIDTFSSAVSLSANPPAGFKTSFSPTSVTPPSNGSGTSTLNVSLQPSVTAGSYTISETGTSGNLSHSTSVTVNVLTTISGVKNVVNLNLGLGAIDNLGIATSLLSKLSAAQTTQTGGLIQTEVNILDATLFEILAQGGKHIKTSWIDGSGQAYNPDAVLATDVTALMSTAAANLVPNPIMGNVVNGTGVGLANISVNILNSNGALVATATSDSAGFFYFPVTSIFTSGSSYTVKVILPKGYKSSSPAYAPFTWKGSAVKVNNIMLN